MTMKKSKQLIRLFFLITIVFYSCNSKNSKNINNTAVNDNEQAVTIENKIQIPVDFNKQYEIRKEEDLSYSNITRKQLRITVPSELSKSDLENNIKHLVIEYYKSKKPDGISVLVYEKGDNVESAYTVAMGEFAPFGNWEKINKNTSLNDYQLNIEFKESYFQPNSTLTD